MPNPNKFKNEKEWMSACMSQLLHKEKKERDQAVVQCLNMWRERKKKGTIINMKAQQKEAAHRVIEAFLKESIELTIQPKLKRPSTKEILEERKQRLKGPRRVTDPKMPFGEKGEMVEDLPTGKLKPYEPAIKNA